MTNFSVRRFRTPEQMAELARRLMDEADHTHKEIAEQLDVDRSSVSHALGDRSTQHVRLLVQILLLYLDDASTYAHYPVERPIEDVLEELGETNPYPDDDPRSAAWAEGLTAGIRATGAWPEYDE